MDVRSIGYVSARADRLATGSGARCDLAAEISRSGHEAGRDMQEICRSDQYAPFHTQVINATVRDAACVLDGLLYHEADLRIEEHYTDTAGSTDHG